MTASEHNKCVGILHVAYSGLQVLLMIVMAVFLGPLLTEISQEGTPGGPPREFLVLVFGIAGALNLILTIPPLIAGYALLKRRPWAKTAAIAGSVVAALSFPIGTPHTRSGSCSVMSASRSTRRIFESHNHRRRQLTGSPTGAESVRVVN